MHLGKSDGDGGDSCIGHLGQLLCHSLAVLRSPPQGNLGDGPRSVACARPAAGRRESPYSRLDRARSSHGERGR